MRDGASAEAPSSDAVSAYLASLDAVDGDQEEVVAGNSLNTRETAEAVSFEAEHDGAWVHRSYLTF